MSKFAKKFLCLLCCFMIVCTSFSGVVFADGYEKYDSSDDDGQDQAATYYIIESDEFSKLWDFGLDDVDDLFDWIWNFRTYTVIKKFTDENGDEVYRGYFNTPNLQHLAKNYVTCLIADGYTDETYDVNETEWLVNVGADAPSENVITKYGFDVPSYTYNGEFPKEIMTVAGVIPSSFWDTLWRAVAALFGASFIKAPDASNFNTITYLNHGYVDKEDFLVEFFSNYYIPYFLGRIANGDEDESSGFVEDDGELHYFDNVEDFLNQTVYNEENESAEDWINSNIDRYKVYKRIQNGYNNFANAEVTSTTRFGISNQFGVNGFTNLVNDDGTVNEDAALSYIGMDGGSADLSIPLAHSDQDNYTTASDADMPWDDNDADTTEAQFQTFLLTQTDYLNAVRDWWDNNKSGNTCVLQSIILNNESHPYYNDMVECSNTVEAQDFFESKINGDNLILIEFILACCSQPAPYGDYYLKRGDTCDFGNADLVDGEPGLNELDIRILDVNPEYASSGISFTTYDETSYNEAVSNTAEGETAPNVEDYASTTTVSIAASNNVLYYHRGSTASGRATITYTDLISFYGICLPNYSFSEDDWMSPNMYTLMERYDGCVQLTNDWDHFNDICNMIADNDDFIPEDASMRGIAYSQCLIPVSDGQDEESCINTDYGENTTITVGSLLGYNGLYLLTPDFDMHQFSHFNDSTAVNMYWIENPEIYEDANTLTPEAAHRIINFIKNASGPYYSYVMQNIVIIMIFNANQAGDTDPLESINYDDVRVMPYDTASMTLDDAENYSVTDPRVDIYKESIIGSFIADMSISFGGIFKFFTPQKTVLTIIGKITEFSVFMQQLCNFDVLDSYGLSPTTIWGQSGFALFIMGCLVLYFIFKTVKCVIDLCKSNSRTSGKVFVGFLVLFLELGFIVAISANPAKSWNTIKQFETNIITLGERATIYNETDLVYLFGDAADMEVTYYMPYLDAWSMYNTGYGILENNQVIDFSSNVPELKEYDSPKIGSNNIGHWSVVLMDAFEYHGYSNSVYNSISIENEDGTYSNINGIKINNNAYRVVDHFLAPRISYEENDDGSKIYLEAEANENYNGKFQKGVFDLLVKLVLAIFICFLSLIKLLTFFWQWYMFYIFFFRVILGKMAEGKNWKIILLQTVAPTAAMILEGSFVGISLTLGMRLTGFLGLIVIIGLFMLTLYMISWWYQLGNGMFFPGTMKWIYALSTMVADPGTHKSEEYMAQARHVEDQFNKDYADESDEWRKTMNHGSVEEQYKLLFNEDGTRKDEYKGKKYDKAVGRVYSHYEDKIRSNDPYIDTDIKARLEKIKRTDPDQYEKLYGKYCSAYNSRNLLKADKQSDADFDEKYKDQPAEWRKTMKSGTIEEKRALLYNEDGSIKAEYSGAEFEEFRKQCESINGETKEPPKITNEKGNDDNEIGEQDDSAESKGQETDSE